MASNKLKSYNQLFNHQDTKGTKNSEKRMLF